MEDAILINQLEVHAHIGVPPAERGRFQRLSISLRLIPARGISGLADDLANTVDYAAVCAAVRLEVESRSRKLIETLADDLARMLLARFPLRAVEIEVRKYILPDTDFVAVQIRREK